MLVDVRAAEIGTVGNGGGQPYMPHVGMEGRGRSDEVVGGGYSVPGGVVVLGMEDVMVVRDGIGRNGMVGSGRGAVADDEGCTVES